jgi:hypothetical protein
VRGHGGDADGAAIRRCLGHQVGADVAAGAGLVVHHDAAQRGLHALGQRARRHVQRAAGGVGHDQADRLGGLREGAGAGGQRQAGEE